MKIQFTDQFLRHDYNFDDPIKSQHNNFDLIPRFH